MTMQDPAARPTAAEALDQWRDIRRGISSFHKAWRLRLRDEPWCEGLMLDLSTLAHVARSLASRRSKVHSITSQVNKDK